MRRNLIKTLSLNAFKSDASVQSKDSFELKHVFITSVQTLSYFIEFCPKIVLVLNIFSNNY